MFGGAAALAHAAQVFEEVGRLHAIGARVVGGEQPVDEKVSEEELVARHVPEEKRLPLLEGAASAGEQNESAVAAAGIEAPVEDLGHVAQPGVALRADVVLAREAGRGSRGCERAKSQAAKTA